MDEIFFQLWWIVIGSIFVGLITVKLWRYIILTDYQNDICDELHNYPVRHDPAKLVSSRKQYIENMHRIGLQPNEVAADIAESDNLERKFEDFLDERS